MVRPSLPGYLGSLGCPRLRLRPPDSLTVRADGWSTVVQGLRFRVPRPDGVIGMCKYGPMPVVVDLLSREMYSFSQVDRILALRAGTARRWIDGYLRQGRTYQPVVRVEPTGSEAVTWGVSNSWLIRIYMCPNAFNMVLLEAWSNMSLLARQHRC